MLGFFLLPFFVHVALTTSSCSKGDPGVAVKFGRIRNYRNASPNVVLGISPATEAECLKACRDLRECESVNYNKATKSCDGFSVKANMFATNPKPKPNQVAVKGLIDYYEKLCAPNTPGFDDRCSKIIDLAPRKMLIGFSTRVLSASSLGECAVACFDANKQEGEPDCLSAMFYPDSPNESCVLNSEDRNTAFLMYTDTIPQDVNVVYFELDCPQYVRDG